MNRPVKKRRKRRGGMLRWLVLLLFVAASAYIAYIAITQPERLSVGLFNKQNETPTFALAEDEGTDNNANGNNNPTNNDADESENLAGSENDTPSDGAVIDNVYLAVSYAIPERLTAYEAYQLEQPELNASDVVWMVNAGLDKPLFTDAEIITDANPLLVNPYHRLPDDFVPTALEVIDESGRQAMPETFNAFKRMRDGAIAAGFDLAVQSAYRTIAYQQGLYDRAGGDGAVARPTYSEHHTGRALDLWGPDGLLDEKTPTETGRWVAENAYEYGFIVRYTEENRDITGYIPEPWHITYVGETIAQAMHDGQYGSLEEYVAKNPNARLP